LHYLNEKDRDIPLIFLTGYGTLESCQEAVREGAFDYILKPVTEKDDLVLPLKHAVERFRLEKRNKEMQLDILRMAEEHQLLVSQLLNDTETRGAVQQKIQAIVDKWKT
jgi:FixJ family two-component response regulator